MYDFMVYNSQQYFCNLQKNIHTIREKKECKQNNKKTLSIKMKEDVGMLKPKKHGNKVGTQN